MTLKVFISYAHKDTKAWKDLEPQFTGLKRQYGIEIWTDHQILPGQSWPEEIQRAMEAADIILLMVSDAFIDSEFCWTVEMNRALERQRDGEATLIPVLLHDCDTEALPFATTQGLPTGFKPISSWQKVREARADVAKGLRKVVERLLDTKTKQEQKVDIFALPAVGPAMLGRQKEIDRLNRAWNDEKTNLVSIVAEGGVGKSAIAKHWLSTLPGYGGASHVYCWSFYSQGSSDQAQTTTDTFFDEALKFFGVEVEQGSSIFHKAETLAQTVASKRAILVLDGVEPLQHGAKPLQGVFKDKAVLTLLQDLGARNRGLCVVTSRVELSELDDHEVIDLETLSDEAGAHLLRSLHVHGGAGDLKAAAREQGGHALAVTLLGVYLREFQDGDATRRRSITDLPLDGGKHQHARRVLAVLAGKMGDGSPETAVLSLLGLFDRPAEPGLIEVLRAEPAIEGLTAPLVGLDEAAWNDVLERLRRLRLISPPTKILDTHPLVREHFGARLETEHPDSWKTAHGRLYEHLRDTTEESPDTVEGLTPLYRAIGHGCAAGRVQEALNEVYWPRVSRESKFFSTKNLGAFSSDLAALSGFFSPPWTQPAAELTETAKALVLNAAAFRLRALGRLREAVAPLNAGLALREELELWADAAIAASTTSELWLALGEIGRAETAGKAAVAHADKSEDKFHWIARRTTLADALHQAGQTGTALEHFREAEAIQAEWQLEYPNLYSLPGYRYCDLLMERGEAIEAWERAAIALGMGDEEYPLLSTSLDLLTQARASLAGAGEGPTAAPGLLDAAVDGLRRAGSLNHLPRGLVARAECRRVARDFGGAKRDLDESERLCRRSEMKLFLADTLLEKTRLLQAQGRDEAARKALAEAATLVEGCGYGRREGAVAALRAELGEA